MFIHLDLMSVFGYMFNMNKNLNQRLNSMKLYSYESDIALLRSFKASKLKEILKSITYIDNISQANLKSIYDKDDLIKLLLDIDNKIKLNRKSYLYHLQMLEFGGDEDSSNSIHVGIEVQIANHKHMFYIDTGASMTVIKQTAAKSMYSQIEFINVTSTGFGGGGNVAADPALLKSMSIYPLLNTSMNEIASEMCINDVNCVILKNDGTLPADVSGILGMSFLSSLGSVLEFNFADKLISVDKCSTEFSQPMISPILSPLERLKRHETQASMYFGGLLVCKVYINNVEVDALLDIGSVSTFVNFLAFQSVYYSDNNIMNSNPNSFQLSNVVNQLESSGRSGQGLDGKLVPVKFYGIDSMRIGDSLEDSFILNLNKKQVSVAEITGLHFLGLANRPAIILGMDVLKSACSNIILDMKNSKVYFESIR